MNICDKYLKYDGILYLSSYKPIMPKGREIEGIQNPLNAVTIDPKIPKMIPPPVGIAFL